MNPDIDYLKMLEQEPEFEKYFKELLFKYQKQQPGFEGIVEMIYFWYQDGSKVEDAVNTMLLWKKDNGQG